MPNDTKTDTTRFGPNWSGKRCGAKTRSGTLCLNPTITSKRHCRLHGGLSTGPRTEAGKERIRQTHLKHGRRTKEAIAAEREQAEQRRQLRKEMWDIESWAVEQGLLKKTWRRDWR